MTSLSCFKDEEQKIRFIKRRARAKFRRQYTKAGSTEIPDDYETSLVNNFNFGIELQPQDQPVDRIEDKVKNGGNLEKEYAARYLEKIGATPTPETVRLVLDNVPLKKCKVTTNKYLLSVPPIVLPPPQPI